MASAWGPHRQQVFGVPVSLSCNSGGGQKGRAVGGGSIHRLPPTLPHRNVVLSPLGARRSVAGSRGAGYIFHLLRWPMVGLVPLRWARWQWSFVRAPKQVVRLTYFPICWLGVPGLGGRTAHVVLQE